MQRRKNNSNRFFAIDLDRTLLNTPLMFETLQDIILKCGYAHSDNLTVARNKVESSGGSYDPFQYVRSLLTEVQYREVLTLLRAEAKQLQLFNSGAKEFLQYLDEHQLDYGILTFGTEEGQREKLAMMGLDRLSAIVISHKGKGAIVSSWYDEEQESFVLPQDYGGGTYKHVVLVDDKVSELEGLPDQAIGLLYRPSDTVVLPSQGGDFSASNTFRIKSFSEARNYCFNSV